MFARSRSRAPGSGFIDPAVLARIDDLELLARTVVEGFISGLHRSPYLGLSMDFAEHRPYMPGDDIRQIDWRVYARTDRFYIKKFEAETNADLVLALDVSRSMDFRTAGVTKLDYGRFLAASLAYMSGQQRDRIGLTTFDGAVIDYVPPSVRHRDIVLHTIDRATPAGAGDLRGPLEQIGESLSRKGIVALISDLYADPDDVLKAVSALRRKGNDLIVFHLLDPAELEFPFDRPVNFEDLETGERIPVTPEDLRDEYLDLISTHRERLTRLMRDHRIDYATFDTSRPLDDALFHYLSHRENKVWAR